MPGDADFLNNVELSDNLFRPYSGAQTPHDQTIANLILYTDSSFDRSTLPVTDINFYNNFSEYIKDLNVYIPNPAKAQSPDGDVVAPGNAFVGTLDGINNYYGVFNNFSLSSVNESSDQIIKLHQNFSGSWNAFFFGKKPQMYTFSGFFLDSKEYPYYQEFMVAYEKYLAGRKCIENKIAMKIMYDAKMVSGYMLNINTSVEAGTSLIKQFQFTVLLTSEPQWLRSNYRYSLNPNNSSPSFTEDSNALDNTARTMRAFPTRDLLNAQ